MQGSFARLLCVLALATLMPVSQSLATDSELEVNIRRIDMRPDEALTALKVRINGAIVGGVANIPSGWTLTIGNEPRWRASVDGGINEVATSALHGDSYKTIRLHIARPSASAGDLEITGSATVTTDFKSERTVTLARSDFEIRKVSP